MSDEYDFNSVEDVDETIDGLADHLQEDYGDLAVSIDILLEAAQDADDDVEALEAAEDIALPFYEEDREVAFAVGLTVGALLEARENVADEKHRLADAKPAQQDE